MCNIKAVAKTLGNPQNCDALPKYLNVDYVCQVSRINNVLWMFLQRVKPLDVPCNNCGCLFLLLFSFLAKLPLTPASQRGTLTLFSAVTYQEDMSIQDMIAWIIKRVQLNIVFLFSFYVWKSILLLSYFEVKLKVSRDAKSKM